MGLMVINGATAGGFSPISVFGSIVNGVVERNDLAENATLLFAQLVRVQLAAERRRVLPVRRARAAPRRAAIDGPASRPARFEREQRRAGRGGRRARRWPAARRRRPTEVPELDRDKILTLIGIVDADRRRAGVRRRRRLRRAVDRGRAVAALAAPPPRAPSSKIAWPTVLLICGIVMYVGLLEKHRHDRLAGRAGRDDRRGADRRAADLLRRRRRVGVRVDHGHPRRADPARGAVPGDRARSARSG